MAKGARASVIKKNKSKLKSRVFGPVEMARNERLSAKLLELASQPKPPRQEMEVEQGGQSEFLQRPPGQDTEQVAETQQAEGDAKTEDNEMDVDGASKSKKSTATGANSDKKSKSGRIQKTRHRRARNEIAFTKHPMKKAKKEKARKG